MFWTIISKNFFFEKKLAFYLEIGYNNPEMICTYKSNTFFFIKGDIIGKFENDAKALLEAVGGKENVAAVSHCATRMRFVLNDEKKANVKAIENLSAVKGTFTNAGQFQVIIGNDVPIFYNDFTAVSGIEGVSKEAAKSATSIQYNVF